MATVLYAWELGANLGHLVPLSRIANKIGEDGHNAVFAVLDLGIAAAAPRSCCQCPVAAPVRGPPNAILAPRGGFASYVDILAAIGFSDPSKLAAMMGAWSGLVDLVKPDAIVADHSPALQMSMRDRGIPVIAVVGSAFTMPPLEYDQFQRYAGDSYPAIPETRLLEILRRAQAIRGCKLSGDLISAFRTANRVVFGLPELDPYRSFRHEQLTRPPGGFPTAQPWSNSRRLFVYVGGEMPNFETLAQALSVVNVPIEAYFRGESGPLTEFLKLRGAVVHEEPPDLNEVLTRCSHMLTQGGAMTAAAGLSAGRPQMVLAGHDEAELNLSMLAQNGVSARGC